MWGMNKDFIPTDMFVFYLSEHSSLVTFGSINCFVKKSLKWSQDWRVPNTPRFQRCISNVPRFQVSNPPNIPHSFPMSQEFQPPPPARIPEIQVQCPSVPPPEIHLQGPKGSKPPKDFRDSFPTFQCSRNPMGSRVPNHPIFQRFIPNVLRVQSGTSSRDSSPKSQDSVLQASRVTLH